MIRALALAFGLTAALPLPALSQSTPASPFLPQDHWSLSTVRRLTMAGAVAGPIAIGRRTVARTEVARALRDAAAAAEAAGSGDRTAALALARFLDEFPTAGPERIDRRAFQGSVAAGLEWLDGRVRTGTGQAGSQPPPEPPVALADHNGPMARLAVTARLGRRAAALVEGGPREGAWELTSAHASVVVGPLLLWGGRRPAGYGPGAGGGVVLGDRVTVDGGGFQIAAPATGSGLFQYLGPVRFETMLGRMGPTGQVENPWFWAARGSVTPHPRFTLGVNRGALFGGDGNVDVPITDLLYILIGKHAGGGSAYENQVVSVDVHYRPPLPLPAELYVEWGFEDSAGAFYNVPGVVWGGAVSGLPGLGSARVGIERADFARSCCGNPAWYRHMFLLAGWTEDGIPLGHPLGGHGDEWLLFGDGGLLEERLQLRASLALRDRRGENLYAPDREGTSRGATLNAAYLHGRWELAAAAALEAGDGWTEGSLRTTVRYSP